MKTILQKDLRENFKMALIGLAIFSLLLLEGYQSCQNAVANVLRASGSVAAGSVQPLLAESVLTEAAFFCAIFGAALGWLQTRNEAHRDLWAFLIHRPISRTDIFRGKVAAGLCLYALGAGLPLLILIGITRMPGHVAAPFEWAMALPLLSIFLTGAVYYFGGLLTGLRQARWYGSKCFGIGWGLVASLCAFTADEFWQSLGATLVAAAILAVAVWGAYQSGGLYRGQPAAGKGALILAMAAGCSAILFAAGALTMALAIQPFMHGVQIYSYYQMTRDGKIYKETLQDNELKSIVDLDGQPLMDPKTGRPIERREFEQRRAYGVSASSTLKSRRMNNSGFRQAARFFRPWNIVDKKLWYVDRHGELVGYDGPTRRFIGLIRPPGFNGTAMAEQFLPTSAQINYFYNNYYNDAVTRTLATARTVYQVDLEARQLKPIFTATSDDEIGGCAENNSIIYEFGTNTTRSVLVTTRKSVLILKMDGQPILQTPYGPSSSEYPTVSVYYLVGDFSGIPTDRFAIWFNPDFQMNSQSGWKMPAHVEWFGAGNSVSRRLDLPTLQMEAQESWPERVADALAPPALVIPSQKHFVQPEPLLSCALDLLCVLACGWLARRYHFTSGATAGWLAFVLIFAIPGLLTLLCVQEWPTREICPKCQKLRMVDREHCEYCAAEFAAPERNGTEIFAPLVKE